MSRAAVTSAGRVSAVGGGGAGAGAGAGDGVGGGAPGPQPANAKDNKTLSLRASVRITSNPP